MTIDASGSSLEFNRSTTSNPVWDAGHHDHEPPTLFASAPSSFGLYGMSEDPNTEAASSYFTSHQSVLPTAGHRDFESGQSHSGVQNDSTGGDSPLPRSFGEVPSRPGVIEPSTPVLTTSLIKLEPCDSRFSPPSTQSTSAMVIQGGAGPSASGLINPVSSCGAQSWRAGDSWALFINRIVCPKTYNT